jgi:hypothetical protein
LFSVVFFLKTLPPNSPINLENLTLNATNLGITIVPEDFKIYLGDDGVQITLYSGSGDWLADGQWSVFYGEDLLNGLTAAGIYNDAGSPVIQFVLEE